VEAHPHGRTPGTQGGSPFGDAQRPDRGRKAMTIGAVCELLRPEFPDISISKIRYLEDQKLLSPRRTEGGYRLYSATDVSRLRTILRLQRDEFLPLRVIRQELAAGRAADESADADGEHRRSRRIAVSAPAEERLTLDQLLDRAGVDERLVRELEEYGVLAARGRKSEGGYDPVDVDIVRVASELARFGVAPRNMRVLRTSTDREAVLIEQVVGPSLRSRNGERRKEAVDALESMAAVVSQLKHLMLVRDLRRLVQRP
jgi:DNA-binding transcriptional MerR regulator